MDKTKEDRRRARRTGPPMTARTAVVLALGIVAAAAARAGQPAHPEGGSLVLDECCYNRAYVQFATDRISPRLLKGDAAKILTPRAMKDLKREVHMVHKFMGRKWDEATWKDHAYVLHRQGQAWNPSSHGRLNVLAATPPPPPDWMRPEFDDSGWPRLRGSLMVGTPPPAMRDDVDALGRRVGCFRYRFAVPDPAGAGSLTLRLVYHGGVRVFLNGQEVARGSLPEGEPQRGEPRRGKLPPDAADDYPLEAYVKVNPDGSMPVYDKGRRKGLPYYIDDCYGSYDDAPAASGWGVPREVVGKLKMGRHGRNPGVFFDRQTWQRVQKLRNRHLGPVSLPPKLLRKGANLLAVEVRASDLHPVAGGYRAFRDPFAPPYYSVSWLHAQLLRLELRCAGGRVPSMRHRPGAPGPEPGTSRRDGAVQVWVEDIHRRVFSTDYSDRGRVAGTLRFVGSINGRFGAQLVVGTARRLSGLTVAPGDLKRADGKATIPASAIAVSYMIPHPVTDLGYLSRGGRDPGRPLGASQAESFLRRYGPPDLNVDALDPKQKLAEAQKLAFFDHIAADPPVLLPASVRGIPAGTCRPVWLTLAVPPDATPGTYRGAVRVAADGFGPVTVPMEAEILPWRVPDTPDWQVVMQIEQSPYAVAEHYKVPCWSGSHFDLIEASFRHLGRIGNDWVFVPVLWNTELGNLRDSPIRWIRTKDGTLAFDYGNMDRYLDLAVKHLGRPRVICFLVMHGGTNTAIQVGMLDERTGRLSPHDMSGNSPTYHQDWRAFGKSLLDHMRARGLDESMYWGYMWDAEGDPNLAGVLVQVAPDVYWASGGHGYGYRPIYRANSQIYNVRYGVHSKKGWKRPDIFLLNPRGGGTVLACGGASTPPVYRLVVDRALVAGCNGVARIAADYWDNIYFRGCKAWHFLIPGMGVASHVLWPGPAGAETSQRFEVLREGVQEAEARIFLEQSLDREALGEELAEKVRDVLFRHNQENFFIPISASGRFIDYFRGWQERSRRLFGAAADAAETNGFDLDPRKIEVTIPARGKARAAVKLRNWTARPRAWKARSQVPWIALDRSAGSAAGHEELVLTLDGAALPAGKPSAGKVVVTDVAGRRDLAIEVATTVGEVFQFLPPDADTARRYFQFVFIPHRGRIPFNVSPGGSQTREVSVLNRSAGEIAWKAAGSAPWLEVAPSSGRVAPQSPIVLRVTARPGDKTSAYHEAAVAISETNGPARIEAPLAVHVIPPYRRPAAPRGAAVALDAGLYKTMLKRYRGVKGAVITGPGEMEKLVRYLPKAKAFQRYLRGGTPYEAVFSLEGRTFAAFSTRVGFADRWTGIVGLNFDPGAETDRLNYEIYVDGELRAQSGFMGPKDDFRLMVVTGLTQAKQLKLVARPLRLPGYALHAFWFDPAFHKP